MKLSIQELREGKEAVLAKVEKFAAEHPRFYIVPDYYEDAHAELILGIFGAVSYTHLAMTVLHCMICMLIITSIMRLTAGTIWMATVTTAAGTAEQKGRPAIRKC